KEVVRFYNRRGTAEVCHAHYVRKYGLYQGGGPAYRERRGPLTAGPLVAAPPATATGPRRRRPMSPGNRGSAPPRARPGSNSGKPSPTRPDKEHCARSAALWPSNSTGPRGGRGCPMSALEIQRLPNAPPVDDAPRRGPALGTVPLTPGMGKTRPSHLGRLAV